MALKMPKRVKLSDSFAQSSSNDQVAELSDTSNDVNKYTPANGPAIINCNDITSNSCTMANGSLSPISLCDSPEFSLRNTSGTSSNASTSNIYTSPLNTSDGRENRRGRPRSEALTTLMIEGSTSPSSIKCSYCNRVFPREKSLQAHLRTHTGERPYQCDYPGCTRAFTQSGQLKTHQRLHTGERPFMCSAPRCQMRFTHANRHCPEHPYDQLKRCDDFVIQAATEQNFEVIKWLQKYKMEKEDRTPTRKTPKRTKHTAANEASRRTPHTSEVSNENMSISNEEVGDENKLPVTPINPYKSRKGLMVELDMNAGLGTSPITNTKSKMTPKAIHWHEASSQEEDSADEYEMPAQSTFNPKKRWLREATWHNDLAKPLDSLAPTNSPKVTSSKSISHHLLQSPPKQPLSISNENNINDKSPMNPNQLRPTVLMVASRDRTMPLLNQSNIPPKTNRLYTTSSPLSNTTANIITAYDSQHLSNNENIYENRAIVIGPGQQQQQSQQLLGQPIQSPTTPESNALRTFNHQSSDRLNRKWLSALALMELASEENSPVSTTLPLVYEH